jgi:SAM-dependent methyltransferase
MKYQMHDSYEAHSLSQQEVGSLIVDQVLSQLDCSVSHLSLLDVGCGPGNLTQYLMQRILAEDANVMLRVGLLDQSADHIAKTTERLQAIPRVTEIQGFPGNMYDASLYHDNQFDVIFSNEAIHWQPFSQASPPYPLDELVTQPYRKFCVNNLQQLMRHFYRALKPGGSLFLQFNHKGTQMRYWQVWQTIFNTDAFKPYQSTFQFPMYYPLLEEIELALGIFREVKITPVIMDYAETSTKALVDYTRAFTYDLLTQLPDVLREQFYVELAREIDHIGIDVFRQNQWHHTMVVAAK